MIVQRRKKIVLGRVEENHSFTQSTAGQKNVYAKLLKQEPNEGTWPGESGNTPK